MVQLKAELLAKFVFLTISFLINNYIILYTNFYARTQHLYIYIHQRCVVLSYYLVLMHMMFYTDYIAVREVQSNSTSGIVPDSMERQTSWINMDFTYHQGNNVISISLQCWYIYSACPRCRVNKNNFLSHKDGQICIYIQSLFL